jgi:type I restriction enzyme S subunit
VKNGEIVNADDVFVNSEVVNCDNVKKGDIAVVVRNGSRSLIGKHAQIKREMKNTVIGAFMTGIRSKQPNFTNALLDTEQFNKEVEKNLGATINQITAGAFKRMSFSFPDADEQTQIGSYFQQLDKLISLHQAKVNKLTNLKKAMLEKMFPKAGADVPEIRFKGFEGAWVEKALSDFGIATSGTSIESEFSDDGKYKVISIGSYSENSTYTDQGIRAIESEKTIKRVLNKDDLAMVLNDKTLSGNIIGRVLKVEHSGSYVYNQRTQRIEPDKVNYDAIFLYQLLNAPLIRKKIFKNAQGNTQIYVNWSKVKELKYLIPELHEQKKIGLYFQSLDKLITLQQTELEKLNNLKKACLEKMFV